MSQRPIPILMYHQIDVAPPRGTGMRGLVVSPFTFFCHMAAMRMLGYRGLSMVALEPYLRGEVQGKVFGITFDDGFENNLRCALPVLQRFSFTSTCYVVAELIGKSNIWDADNGVAQVPLMNARQLQAWVDGGQELGSHTLTHAKLTDLDARQQMKEIAQSKSAIDSCVQQQYGVRHFCYPYGAFDSVSIEAVKAVGYVTATTTLRGRVSPTHQTDMLMLPRVLVSRTTSWLLLLWKCLTTYEDRRVRIYA